ncbi:hypothetical protein [Mycobacteroides sp. CBMA 271]|nr:hypothetical protein [Mycobacteroides sp. CBMA 271]
MTALSDDVAGSCARPMAATMMVDGESCDVSNGAQRGVRYITPSGRAQ